MTIKNQSEIQILKILFKTQKKKPTKNLTSQRAYPHGIEQKYFRQLESYFAPLTNYVKKYLSENINEILRGDSNEIRLDAIPGKSFDKMLYSLENWLSIYMPDISELDEGRLNNVIYTGIGKTAEETMNFSEQQFKKMLEKGVHVELPLTADWWEQMKTSWAEDNYTLIVSNAKNYVSKINSIVEQGVVNGQSVKKVTEAILNATDSLTKKHCKLLARDQIGKLTGQINQAQMEEIGLDLYVWDTSMDDRVRDSHAIMQGLLCRWDDASVCSYDGGKTWEPRPAGAVDLHPGQDIQCRCSALGYYPELISELEGKPMEIVSGEELAEDLGGEFVREAEYIRDNILDLENIFNYTVPTNEAIFDKVAQLQKSGGINPHFEDSKLMKKGFRKYQYTENCQRCVPTLQMKMKGFEVEALPLPKKTPDSNDMCYGSRWYDWLRDKKGNPVQPTNVFSLLPADSKMDATALLNRTIDLIKEAPEGSMFELKCSWKRGGGHVFSAFSVGEKGVIFYDPQGNTAGDAILKYFTQMKLDSLEVIRTDDKIINKERIIQCCKNK